MNYESQKSKLLHKYLSISDLAAEAKKRIPTITWTYHAADILIEDLKK